MKKIIYTFISLSPVLALAQTVNLGFLNTVLTALKSVVSALIPILFGLAIVYFFWGLATYIRSAGDPKKASEGKSIMIYGIIAIAVMGSLYGIVGWLQGVFGIQGGGGNVVVPTVPGL